MSMRANEHSALFIDHIALAFYAHITRATARPCHDDFMSGGIVAWQLRRVRDFLCRASE